MPRIFICYRRTDTQQAAGRLRETLVRHFGKEQIFRDIDSMQGGSHWPDQVRQVLSGDAIVLALIGSRWTAETKDGGRVVGLAHSATCVELETALGQKLTIVPLLVDDTPLPPPEQLPQSLQAVATIHALRLRDADWPSDVRGVISRLETLGVAPASALVRARQWLAEPMVLLAVAVVAIAIGAANVFYSSGTGSSASTPPSGPPLDSAINADGVNVQMVFDRSDAMTEAFGARTRLDEARDAVATVLGQLAEGDNLSWREFGGECSGTAGPAFWLPFARGKERIEQRLKTVTTSLGAGALATAVIEATANFNQVRSSRKNGSRIVVITGGYSKCQENDPDPLEAITERLKSYPELTLDLRFIGVGLAPAAQSLLGALAQATGATFTNARDPAHLVTVLQQVLVIEPRLGDVQNVIDVLDQSSMHVNTAIDRINRKDYDGADRALQQAVDAFPRTEIPRPDSRQPAAVRQLIDIAREGRDEQQKMLEAVKALSARSRSADPSGIRAAQEAYNAASTAYNERTGRIKALQEQILEGTP